MDNIADLALGTTISCSGAASRPMASSANESIQKFSPDHVQVPIVLDFGLDNGLEIIQKWHSQQPATWFTIIEYRKETGGRFRHEFVVAHLDNGTFCRFDRRARKDKRGHALKDEGTISEDSAHVITGVDEQSRADLDKSEVLLRVDIPEGQDLEFILAVCYGVQSHPKAKSYSLLYYNCYFFSWTLITLIARKACQWPQSLNQIWDSIVNSLPYKWGDICYGISLVAEKGIKRALAMYPPSERPGLVKMLLLKSELADILKRWIFSVLWCSGRDMIYMIRRGCFNRDGRRPSRREAEKFWKALYNSIMANIDGPINEACSQHLKDPTCTIEPDRWILSFNSDDGRRLYINQSIFGMTIKSDTILQEYIGERMEAHFKQVQSYGFGKAERLMVQAEQTMTEIWVSLVNLLEGEPELR